MGLAVMRIICAVLLVVSAPYLAKESTKWGVLRGGGSLGCLRLGILQDSSRFICGECVCAGCVCRPVHFVRGCETNLCVFFCSFLTRFVILHVSLFLIFGMVLSWVGLRILCTSFLL